MKMKNVMIAICLSVVFMACKKENESVAAGEEVLAVETGSTAAWKGYLETGYFNSGTIALEAEDFLLKGEEITGGEISIPISSIVVTNDLPADKKLELTHHLQSADFFNLALYPHVVYTVRSAQKTAAVDPKGNNYLIKGDLKLLGKSLPLDIPAKITISATDVEIVSNFTFDRTKWGMTYASDVNLPAADKIKNEIEVDIDLKAIRF
jgi:Uncharacterized conserved protein